MQLFCSARDLQLAALQTVRPAIMGQEHSPNWGDICVTGDNDASKCGAGPVDVHAADMFDLMEQGVGGSALTTLR